jgi:hypothetical protein
MDDGPRPGMRTDAGLKACWLRRGGAVWLATYPRRSRRRASAGKSGWCVARTLTSLPTPIDLAHPHPQVHLGNAMSCRSVSWRTRWHVAVLAAFLVGEAASQAAAGELDQLGDIERPHAHTAEELLGRGVQGQHGAATADPPHLGGAVPAVARRAPSGLKATALTCTDGRSRWSPDEENSFQISYHRTTGNRCADRQSPRSPLTVGGRGSRCSLGEGMCSLTRHAQR